MKRSTSLKTRDVPWSYAIEWQFAEPVWDEEGSGDDVTYTPRPPDESQGEELVPSTVLTGRHRLKQDTSPLYLGDMTSSAGGLAYARAVIRGVNISGGEVVQGTGTTELASAWVAVNVIEELFVLDDDGHEIDDAAIYYPKKTGGFTVYGSQDPAEFLSVILTGEFDAGAVDTITAGFHETFLALEETGNNTLVFSDAQVSLTISFVQGPSFDEEAFDSVDVVVTDSVYGLDDRELTLIEDAPDSKSFRLKYVMVTCALPSALSSSETDMLQIKIWSSHYPNDVITGTWDETGANTRTFEADPPVDVVTISGTAALDPNSVDELTLSLSVYSLNEDEGEITVTETAADSRIFVSHSDPSVIGDAYPDVIPEALFHPAVRRWPAVIGEELDVHIMTATETTTVAAAMLEAGLFVFPGQLYATLPEAEGDGGVPDSAEEIRIAKDIIRVMKGMTCEESPGEPKISIEQTKEYIGALMSTRAATRAVPFYDYANRSLVGRQYVLALRCMKPLKFYGCAFVGDPWTSGPSNSHMKDITEALQALGYVVIQEPQLTQEKLFSIYAQERDVYVCTRDPRISLINVWYIIAHTKIELVDKIQTATGIVLDGVSTGPPLGSRLESWATLLYLNGCITASEELGSRTRAVSSQQAAYDAGLYHAKWEKPLCKRDVASRFHWQFYTVEYVGNLYWTPVKAGRKLAKEFFEKAGKKDKGLMVTVEQAVDLTNKEPATFGPYDYEIARAPDYLDPLGELDRRWRVISRFTTGANEEEWWE